MNTRISTRPASPWPSLRRWLANAFARWTERIDSMSMPAHHRMGSWEGSLWKKPRE